jgi:hypothetical protein
MIIRILRSFRFRELIGLPEIAISGNPMSSFMNRQIELRIYIPIQFVCSFFTIMIFE